MTAPLISIVIPTWNGERFVAAAITSALEQTYAGREVIVVDDGSTDRTQAVLEGFAGRIGVVTQENRGTSAARNRGVDAAGGALLAFLDHDDVWYAEKLEAQAEAMEMRPDIDVVFCRMRLRLDVEDSPRTAAASLTACCPSGMLVRRGAFTRVGPFDESIAGAEFADWYVRARECGLREHTVGRVLLERRVHSSNQSRGERVRAGYARVLKGHLERRRR